MAFTSAQIQSSSASYPTSPPTNWDVFLSFYGKDTRNNFTSHLYSALHRHGIRTFMDDPELRSGEVISDALLRAIQDSKIYIVVLSENYASSSWCLDELAEILTCHKEMQRLVVPVFFNIDPAVVRHQTGSFKQAFQKHQVRFVGEKERVKNWRLTLTQVADKSGKHISKESSEADIIDEIIDEILLKINPTALDVAKYPVGLESRVKDITALLSLSSGTRGAIKIGIYGMGGIGKTTLAKALFNQLLPGSFEGSCFLANVREISGTLKGLESLQQQLINDVLKSKNKFEVNSVDQGTKLIKARICSKTILFVMDDLDDQKQFDSLVGPFPAGSVVIVTTRNEEILDKIKVKTKYRYRVRELDEAESLKLFFQHAFGDTKPNKTLMAWSKYILLLAGGLPLALEIFGSSLYKRSEVGWKSYFEQLQCIPNSSIQQRLKISLDALEPDHPMLKKMFLDIACFFIGMARRDVVEILETYYSCANSEIEVLKKRCLLTINDRDELGMHDLLQEMGREIACNSSPDEPGKHSRLWVANEICDMLKKCEGTKAIEGIKLYYFDNKNPFNEVSFVMEAFKKMCKLRFLHLHGVNVTGNFGKTLNDLRWFRWDRCPLKFLPLDFCPKKLVILELLRCNMTTMWEVNMVSQDFEKLKTLNMSFSLHLTTTPDFTKMSQLKTLNLEGCESLEEVHKSIGSLKRLVSLYLTGCVKLRSLPDSICGLRALKTLNIDGCGGLKALPEKLGRIESLTEINARRLNISELPDSIGRLSKLVKLTLDLNKKLETLPITIFSLSALEVLSINHCTYVESWPVELKDRLSLSEPIAGGLTVLNFPDSKECLSKLVKLDLSNNKKLETLPDTVCNLRALITLSINYCTSLRALPEALGNIKSLTEINARGLNVSKLPDSIGFLRKLVKLILDLNKNLETLPDTICSLRALEVLSIDHCNNMAALPDNLGNIESLRELNAIGLNVTKLPDSIGRLTKLVKLDLTNYRKLETLPDTICSLRALEVLSINHCNKMAALPDNLGNIESLRELNAIGLNVTKLPDSTGRLTKLVKLDLTNNPKLETLPDTICNLSSLETLSIHGCDKLDRLPDELWKITSLRKLDASGRYVLKLPDIGSSQTALSLQILNLRGSGITALPSGLSQLSNLEDLHLSFCHNLFSIPKLPPNLKRIEAHGCKSLERLPNLSNLKHLETLDLTDCSGLTEIQGLEELTSLRELTGCNPSLLTKRLFQMYSVFGHETTIIRIGSEKFPEWISQSSQDGTRMSLNVSHDSWEEEFSDSSELSENGSTLCLKLPPNMSYDYMGMILCFKCPKDGYCFDLDYSVKTSSYNYMRSYTDVHVDGSCMVIVPRSVFSVTDADLRIVIKTFGDEEVLAHLLLKSEVKMTDEHNIRAVNDLKFVDPELLDIFLDIACFFIGWKYTEVVKILETWYSYVNHKIDFLKENCLLTINDTDKLEMPDWLQHIGRKIARNNSPDELEKHSRLWLSIDIFDLLKNHTGTIEIEGIVQSKVDYQDALEGESFTTKTFESMSKLRFLYLRNVNLIGSFERTLEDLRWLCWDGCPLEYLPSEFYPQKLVILELSHSKLRTFWKPNMVSHVFDKLKTLNMSYSQDLITTPDFTKLPCLETLNFEYCESLEEVHESIGSLVRLFSLNLHDCGKLETLPDTICNLKALEYLEIGGCSGLYALPIEMGNIESLIVLNAKGLNVSKLPDTIGRLSKLVELRLGCNKNLEALPNTICNLSSLEILDISGCEKLEILPDKLWKLTRLNELNVSGAKRLIKLPDIEPSQIAFSLKTLKLSESSLTYLPLGISQLSALEYLDLTDCGNLLSIPELLPNMKRMYAGGCTSMKRLPNLSNLKQLEGLDLEYCSGLTVILGLEELTSITEIYLQGCTSSLLAQTLTKRLFQVWWISYLFNLEDRCSNNLHFML